MNRATLFLDIDGVLNHHIQFDNKYCGIVEKLAKNLEPVVAGTSCKIVIVSAWRYLVLNGYMTLDGFKAMLLTHGVPKRVTEAVIGVVREDKSQSECDRGEQIKDWLQANPSRYFAALDDEDSGISEAGIPLVRTDSRKGLDSQKMHEVMALLNPC